MYEESLRVQDITILKILLRACSWEGRRLTSSDTSQINQLYVADDVRNIDEHNNDNAAGYHRPRV